MKLGEKSCGGGTSCCCCWRLFSSRLARPSLPLPLVRGCSSNRTTLTRALANG